MDEDIVQEVSEVFLQSTHEFLKNKKKALNLFVNAPREPLPGTSRHKVGVMASHRLYAELFWRFTQWTSATASIRTYTLPLCDVELTLVEALAKL